MPSEHSSYNNLFIHVYSSGSTPITDPDSLLIRAGNIRFSTIYPGGIYSMASFSIPLSDITRPLSMTHMQRVVISNGLNVIWEGFIADILYSVGMSSRSVEISCLGYWSLLFVRFKRNRWIDRRFDAPTKYVWAVLDGYQNNKCTFDKNQRLMFIPKLEAWAKNDKAAMQYLTNGSSNVKRIRFDYAFSEIWESTAKGVKDNALTDQANAYDNNVATSVTVTLTTGQYFYVGFDKPYGRILFLLGATVNTNVSTLTVEYHNGTAWGSVSGMADGTALGGATWGQDGYVTFTIPGDWDPDTLLGASRMYWVRLSVSANLTANVIIEEITVSEQQAWELELFDARNSISLWSTTSTGTGSQDLTLGTSTDWLEFRFYCRASTQTPIGSGIYGKITNLAVMAENAYGALTTTPSTILKACVDNYASSPFSTNTLLVDATNTYDLIPTGIVDDDLDKSLAEFMMGVAAFSSDNSRWAVGVRESEYVAGGTEPLIYYERQPVLTDYDYVIRIDEENLTGDFRLVASALPDVLLNWIFVQFRDSNGYNDWAFSAIDTASYGKYLGRWLIVNAPSGITTGPGADAYGYTILNARKNLMSYISGPITVKGALRGKSGGPIPVSQVRAGKRIKIENFLTDFGDVTGTGFTFLISQTEYNDADETVQLTVGRPDGADLTMASSK